MSMRIVQSTKKILDMSHPSQTVLNGQRPSMSLMPKAKVVIGLNSKQDKKTNKIVIKLEDHINKSIVEQSNPVQCPQVQNIKQEQLENKETKISMEITHTHFELKVPKIIVPKSLEIPKILLPSQIKIEQEDKLMTYNQTNLLKQQLIQIKKCNEPIQLLLQENDKRKKYYSRAQREKEDVIHWGQRKLLISEIWFLTKYGCLSRNIIYAGAAPGFHIQFLSDLFQNHKFYLFDPNDFQVKQGPKITIYQRCFTNEEAQKFKELFQNDYLFISDIRTANFKCMTPMENEQAVLRDNQLQMEWVKILKPQKAMLKFRCAYPTEINEPTEFFQGEIYIQAWAPASSTETRLVPYDYVNTIPYDNVKYEEQMFYHNDVVRKKQKGALSWDDRAETEVLIEYLRNSGIDENQIIKQVNLIKDQITKKLNYQ
ncbi:unnamed protein product (macronuclear) [Paramecium tetraurelia]|uniref:Cap-specific mRNA (nucleoside-2'-O-)-methyltransferase n=1 Tax=Paramecium tetraurelia TaxID=5888 RepID=A0E8V4_PARTE|nr:uncharacterized protein GSPATT00024452001 [Paramecium tetraurelia]CAK91721.1 unnamed protein product [Paramecium tetraurelia]|eukprot:XP_001459118.1 hypothetical protein (macronuclear) [Paramecium tetraurelia strain d4-2]